MSNLDRATWNWSSEKKVETTECVAYASSLRRDFFFEDYKVYNLTDALGRALQQYHAAAAQLADELEHAVVPVPLTG